MLALAALPPVFLAISLVRFRVQVPLADQWSLVPLLEKLDRGDLGLADLWAQHNEHRLVFPRALMLLLARATGWDTDYELALSVLLALGLVAVLARAARARDRPWILPALSLLVFSLAQDENWLNGWQLQVFLNVLTASAALLALAAPDPRPARLAGAMALALVATFSFSNGLLVWPLGLALLLAPRDSGEPRPSARVVLAWAAAAVLVSVAYFHGYLKPPRHPSLLSGVRDPAALLEYVLLYLGAPVGSRSRPVALVAGAVALACLGACLARPRSRAALRPWIGLAGYALASAVVTGLARVGFRVEQALAPRYITISSLLWVALLVVLADHPWRWTRAALVLALLRVGWVSFIDGPREFRAFHDWLTPIRAELVSGDDDRLLLGLCNDVELVRERRQVLRRLRLSVFRDLPAAPVSGPSPDAARAVEGPR